jgi:peptidoglycan/xylan/chitin deacetylase (PgdA/CDA1 family)
MRSPSAVYRFNRWVGLPLRRRRRQLATQNIQTIHSSLTPSRRIASVDITYRVQTFLTPVLKLLLGAERTGRDVDRADGWSRCGVGRSRSSSSPHVALRPGDEVRAFIASLGKQAGGIVSAGLHEAFGSRAAGRFAILMYHRVAEQRQGIPAPTWNVTPRAFRQQIEGLRARGFAFASLRSVMEAARTGTPVAPNTVVITFDDGYRNNYLHAWPVLRELKVPATIFVASAFLDTGKPFSFDSWSTANASRTPREDWQPLTWAECQAMTATGLVEIGSHSHSHVDFRGDASRLRADLADSASVIREQLNLERRDLLFAFPYGGRDQGYSADALMDVVKAQGFACALTTETELADVRSSPFGWGRIEAVDSDSAATLAAKAAGWYEWMGAARRAFRVLAPAR